MITTNTTEPQNWREYRRLRVCEMHQQGQRHQAIAAALGLTQGAVSQIIARAEAGGVTALQYHKPQGAKPRLTAAQKADLLGKLRQGATAHGFQNDVWTCERIAQLIAKEFGVTYHPDYIGPLLRQLGWSVQRPIVRATQRDETAIAEWAATDLPALKKAQNEERTLLYIDESAFYLLPGVVTTWAPTGETPVLRCKLTRDHLSVISAISPAGKLYLAMQETAFDSDSVVAFLKLLLEEISGKLLIIWDGAPIHRSKTIQQFLTDGAAARIWLARLPAYAPDLNPDEGIWHYLKHIELKNTCCADLADLRQKLTTATDSLSHKSEIIKACFAQVGYY